MLSDDGGTPCSDVTLGETEARMSAMIAEKALMYFVMVEMMFVNYCESTMLLAMIIFNS